MSTTLHSTIHPTSPTNQGIHVIHNYVYSDAATRLAASGFSSTDIGKVALQSDDGSFWVLTATTPTWLKLGNDPTIQTVADASDTIDDETEVIVVTHADAKCVLTAAANGKKSVLLVKHNASSFGVEIVPATGGTVNGQATNASISPTFFESPSTSTFNAACLLLRTASLTWITV